MATLTSSSALLAQPAEEDEQPPKALTVAILDFEANDLPIKDMGAIVGETVTVMLAGEPGLDVVDRASLQETLREHELNQTGLVDTAEAVKVGELVGARILVVGRVFQLGQRTFITAKLIGTETTRVDGVLVQGKPDVAIDELVIELAQKVSQRLREKGVSLVASDSSSDPLNSLREALKGRKLPRVAVVIEEEHIADRAGNAPADPAAETEVKRLLRSVGIEVQDVAANQLTSWIEESQKGEAATWPRGLDNVDMVIAGAAFSEFSGQIGNLNSAAARVEINLIERSSGEVLVAERATTRSVDLAAGIAGKTALEKGGRSVGLEILQFFVNHLPANNDEKPGNNPR